MRGGGGGSQVPGSQDPRSWGPGPIFTPCHFGAQFQTPSSYYHVLHWWANLNMLSEIFAWSFSVLKSLVQQCITIATSFCLIVGTTHDFMSSVFVAGRYLTKNLLSVSDISQLFTSLIIEHPTRSATFFCYQFFDFLSVKEIGIKFILSCASDFPFL